MLLVRGWGLHPEQGEEWYYTSSQKVSEKRRGGGRIRRRSETGKGRKKRPWRHDSGGDLLGMERGRKKKSRTSSQTTRQKKGAMYEEVLPEDQLHRDAKRVPSGSDERRRGEENMIELSSSREHVKKNQEENRTD